MTTYYVATLARYVLVDAANETEAIVKARPALHVLFADVRDRLGKDVPIEIRTARPATSDEIDDAKWFKEKCDDEAELQSRRPGDSN